MANTKYSPGASVSNGTLQRESAVGRPIHSTAEAGLISSAGTRLSLPFALLQTAIPICVPPGNGSTVGLQFTNASGAFSLTTSTFTNTYAGGIWLYMPVGAFDGVNPTSAGFYWAVMSSGSAGQLYGATYQSAAPTVLPAIATTSARWLTQVTSAIVLVQASLSAGVLGKNGSLTYRHIWSVLNSAGTKTLNLLLDTGTNVTSLTPTTNGGWNGLATVSNRGVANKQVSAGQGTGGQGFTSMTGAAATYSVDTSAAIAPGASCQLAANTDYIILESLAIQVCPL